MKNYMGKKTMLGKDPIAILNGKIVTPIQVIEKGVLVIEDGRITDVGTEHAVKVPRRAERIDASGKILAPGFIDVHTHGAVGKTTQESYEAIDEVSKYFAKCGTTGFFSTTFGSLEEIMEGARVAKDAIEKGLGGAQALGLHLEGPYLNPRKPGAGDPKTFRHPSIEEFEKIQQESGKAVKLVSIAPEIDGALEFIEYVTKRGIVAAIGHSYATYEEVLAGIKAGISHVCHTYNAQRELHHREPGVVGAALCEERLMCELIADSYHVHPAAMKVLWRTQGTDHIDLITDSTTPAGLPEGEYDFLGLKVIVKGGKCVIPRPPVSSALEGTPEAEKETLAGSMATMNGDVRNMVKLVGVTLQDAIKMATINPAREFGFDNKGRLERGKDADVILIDEDANIYMTIVDGKIVYRIDL